MTKVHTMSGETNILATRITELFSASPRAAITLHTDTGTLFTFRIQAIVVDTYCSGSGAEWCYF